SRLLSVAVIHVNTAPTVTLPADLTSDQNLTVDVQGVSLADADGDTLTLTVSATHGRLTMGGQSGDTLRRTGGLVLLNQLLAGLRFTPTAESAGDAVITVQASDGTATASGTLTVTLRDSHPTVVITTAADLTNASPIVFTFTFSEPVVGFTAEDV